MLVNHSEILARNESLLLPTDKLGMCTGINWEGVALYFAGDLALFSYLINELCAIPTDQFGKIIEKNRQDRIELIKKLKEKILAENSLKYADWDELPTEKKIILEEKLRGRLALIKVDNKLDLINALLESITAYHYVHNWLVTLNYHKLPTFIDIKTIFPFLLPYSLLAEQSSQGKGEFVPLITEAAELGGAYSPLELRDYFKILTETLLTLPLQDKPITIVMYKLGHIFSFCWDFKTKKNWIHIDANFLPAKNFTIKDNYKSISEVFLKMDAPSDFMFLVSKFYVKKEDVDEVNNWLALCAKDLRWQQIHTITFRKAQSINERNDCFLFLPVVYLKNKEAMLKELFSKGSAKYINTLSEKSFSPLIFAATHGDFETSKLLIENGAEINLMGLDGNALYFATYVNNFETAQLLLEKGARLSETPKSTWNCIAANGSVAFFNLFLKFKLTPSPQKYLEMLNIALERGHLTFAELLIPKVENINQFFKNDCPLAVASAYGHFEMVKLLIKKGAKVDAKETDESKTPLWYAAKNGHIKTVELLLDNGANPNASTKSSPLIMAVEKNFINIAEMLIRQGADVNFQDQLFNVSVLFFAASKGQLEIVKLLLEYKADVNFCRKNGESVFDSAIKSGNLDIVLLLLSYNPQLKINDPKVLDLLCKAMAHHREDIFGKILLRGFSLNAFNTNGETLLSVAAGNGAINWLTFLLNNQAKIDLACNDGTTALWHAAHYGQLDAANYLIKCGAPLNVSDNEGMTPLAIACQKAHLPIVNLLVQSGAAINKANKKGATPLYLAAVNGDTDIVKLLIANGADVNLANQKNQTPLFIAIIANPQIDIELIALLIEKTENIYQPDVDNKLAISNAAYYRRFDIVQLFLQKDPNFDYQSSAAQFILSCAIVANEFSLVEFLIASGMPLNKAPLLVDAIDQPNAQLKLVIALINGHANVNYKNENLESPLWHAAKRGYLGIIGELIANGAKVDSANKLGMTPLWIAAEQDQLNCVERLLKHGANINQPNNKGETPLMGAILNGHVAMVEFLLKKGANVNALSIDKQSALSIAIANNQIDIVKLLLTHQVNVNPSNQQGQLIFPALINQQLEIANLLIDYGIHKTLNFVEKIELLCTLIQYDRHEIFLRLMKENFFLGMLDQPNSQNMTPLNVAIKEGMTRLMLELIQLGANVNQTVGGTLPIVAAAEMNDAYMMHLLIRHGARIDFTLDGQTLMHVAAKKDNMEMIELLITNNLNVNAVNHLHETPLAIAVKHGNLNAVITLLKQGADPQIVNHRGAPPIFDAIGQGNIEMVKQLLTPTLFSFAVSRTIFDPNNRDPQPVELTLFHVAAIYGQADIFRLLLDRYGLAAAEFANNDNQKAYDFAAKLGHQDIVSMIENERSNANLISQSVFRQTSSRNNNNFDPNVPTPF